MVWEKAFPRAVCAERNRAKCEAHMPVALCCALAVSTKVGLGGLGFFFRGANRAVAPEALDQKSI